MNFPSHEIKNLGCNEQHVTGKKILPSSRNRKRRVGRTMGSFSQRAGVSKLFLSTRDRISGSARDFHARSARCRINVIKISPTTDSVPASDRPESATPPMQQSRYTISLTRKIVKLVHSNTRGSCVMFRSIREEKRTAKSCCNPSSDPFQRIIHDKSCRYETSS